MKWKLTVFSIINLEKEQDRERLLKIKEHIKFKPQQFFFKGQRRAQIKNYFITYIYSGMWQYINQPPDDFFKWHPTSSYSYN
jgi:hypothetical protein